MFEILKKTSIFLLQLAFMVHETNKAYFKNLLPNRFLPS